MMEIKRYSLPDARMHRVVESPDGEWARWEDVRLQAIEALNAIVRMDKDRADAFERGRLQGRKEVEDEVERRARQVEDRLREQAKSIWKGV